MEVLPGRLLVQALQNAGLYESCRQTLALHGLDIEALAEVEVDPALGNGGLGRLVACLLESMANLGVPAYGYGIRYDCGLFAQHIVDGWQIEKPDRWLLHGNPWEIPRRELHYHVKLGGRVLEPSREGSAHRDWIETEDVAAAAYDMPIPGFRTQRFNTLRLWSPRAIHELDLSLFNGGDHGRAFSSRNAMESLSQVLYPGDATAAGRELRFKQEYFFVSASVQDILRRFQRSHHSFDQLPDKLVIQINDTHPSLAIAELMRLLIDAHQLEWERAWKITRSSFAYTNHTLMPEALEAWPVEFFERLLPRHLQIVYEINEWMLREASSQRPGDGDLLRRISLVDEEGGRRIRMGHLAVVGSRKVNGVSQVHTGLMKRTVFADFDSLYPEKIVNVTNGISFRRWLLEANPDLAALICSRIGNGWLSRPADLAGLRPHAEDPAFRAAFRAIKRQNKERLAELIARECGASVARDSLFNVQIKRIHEYKRQSLKLLHVVALYDRLRQGFDQNRPARTVIFAGKAAPGYAMAKLIVKLIHDVAEKVNADPIASQLLRLAFVPDYSVSRAQVMIPGAELSEQISTAGYEASGTGNMKLALNGAITIGTLDGANVEIRQAVGEENFFAFGADVEQAKQLRTGGHDPLRYYNENTALKSALDLIASGHFSPSQRDLFKSVTDSLIGGGDPYLVLADFSSYLRCQDEVEALYGDIEEWTRRAILNVAGVWGFSSDRAVEEYADLIWKAEAPAGTRAPHQTLGSESVTVPVGAVL